MVCGRRVVGHGILATAVPDPNQTSVADVQERFRGACKGIGCACTWRLLGTVCPRHTKLLYSGMTMARWIMSVASVDRHSGLTALLKGPKSRDILRH